jgi:hypothetical protein
MEFSVVVKKTPELTNDDWSAYIIVFNEIFGKNYTKDDFLVKYLKNETGYAIHSLLYCDGVLVGSQSYMLEEILYHGRKVSIACGCDTFISPKKRKRFSSLNDLVDAAIPVLREHGVIAYIGQTRKEILAYLSSWRQCKLIGNISNYILPICPMASKQPGAFLINPCISLIARFGLTLMTFNKRKFFRGDELFRPADDQYYTPSAYFSQELALPDGLRFNYFISSKNHIIFVHDNFERVSDLMTAILFLLKKHDYKVRAVEYQTCIKIPLPFIRNIKDRPFCGEIISSEIEPNEFFNLSNWKYKRGYFD